MKMTRQRKALMEVLEKNNKPLSVEMIRCLLQEEALDLSTIYRNLDRLFIDGLISRGVINQTSYYYLINKEHHHYMICLSCRQMFEFDCHIDEVFAKIRLENKFQVTHHDLTFYGYCAKCQETGAILIRD